MPTAAAVDRFAAHATRSGRKTLIAQLAPDIVQQIGPDTMLPQECAMSEIRFTR